MEQIKITQYKSQIGTTPKQRKTLVALGLKGIGKSKVHNNSPEIKGMIRIVNHLVKVENND